MEPPPLMRPELEAAALGLIQGATELLPVSSSAHVAMVPWLLGCRYIPHHRVGIVEKLSRSTFTK